MRRDVVVICVVLFGFACERERPHSDTALASNAGSPRTPLPPSSLGSSVAPSKLSLLPIAAGYGGVGPATPAPYPDLFVVLFFDLKATGKLTGVAIKELELLDGAGTVVARAKPSWSVRRDTTAAGARRKWDFSEDGTDPFVGNVEPGQDLRLRVHAPLDVRSESLKSPPVRFRLLVEASGDPGARVEGAIEGPWPTG